MLETCRLGPCDKRIKLMKEKKEIKILDGQHRMIKMTGKEWKRLTKGLKLSNISNRSKVK